MLSIGRLLIVWLIIVLFTSRRTHEIFSRTFELNLLVFSFMHDLYIRRQYPRTFDSFSLGFDLKNILIACSMRFMIMSYQLHRGIESSLKINVKIEYFVNCFSFRTVCTFQWEFLWFLNFSIFSSNPSMTLPFQHHV